MFVKVETKSSSAFHSARSNYLRFLCTFEVIRGHFIIRCKMKFCDCLKFMYFHVKLVAESENNKIKAIRVE